MMHGITHGRANMTDKLRRRSDVPIEDRWDLTPLYPSDSDWEREFSSTADFAEDVLRWSGRLGESSEILLEIIREIESRQRAIEKLYVYAHLRHDEDLSNSLYDDMHSRVVSRSTRFATATSFFRPELLRIPSDRLEEWLQTEHLRPYGSFLEEILRYRPYTLSDEGEKLLSMSSEIASAVGNAFGKLNNVDMPARLPEITDEQGNVVRLTNSNLIPLLQSASGTVRKKTFDGFYGELEGNVNTLAALLDGQVKTNSFYARARGYPSSIEASLFRDRISVAVYDSLISSVHDNLPGIHRYYALKKKVLGLEEMRMYDLHVPIMEGSRRRYTFNEAVELTLLATAPLGQEYTDTLKKGFSDRWVDRFENESKRSGAFSSGCFDSYPYILHNFTGTLSSVFTLAHEAGHSMHSWHSNHSQPYHLADYRILLGEVASTTNEILLAGYLMENSGDRAEKAHIIDHIVNSFRRTVFRQTMFAEYEKTIHEHLEHGGSLNPEYFDRTYMELIRLYHGSCFEYDGSAISKEWARIPHFYYGFYVYKYATGMASAVRIAKRILEGEENAVEDYLKFLSGGSSLPPLELLRNTGIDLETAETVDSALDYFTEQVIALEDILLGRDKST
jgi:oligoendopeptidase F